MKCCVILYREQVHLPQPDFFFVGGGVEAFSFGPMEAACLSLPALHTWPQQPQPLGKDWGVGVGISGKSEEVRRSTLGPCTAKCRP